MLKTWTFPASNSRLPRASRSSGGTLRRSRNFSNQNHRMLRKLSTIILLAALSALTGTAVAADAASPAKRYLITDSGAVAGGLTLNTKAIQSAIDRCATNGGGVVVVPKGTF